MLRHVIQLSGLLLFLLLNCVPGSAQTQFAPLRGVSFEQPLIAPSQISRTFGKGTVASASWVDSNSLMFLQAFENNGTGTPQNAFITIQSTRYDLTSQLCTPDPLVGEVCRYTRTTFELGSGDIPIADLTITATSGQLLTDISTNPNFSFTRCDVDDVAGTTTCVSTPPIGVVDVTWKRTSTNYLKQSGSTETKTGPQIVKMVGSSQQFSATATGSIIGVPIKAIVEGVIGTNSTRTIQITITP